MRLKLVICSILIWCVGYIQPAAAHEVNPAYLQLSEIEPGRFEVVWKQPLKDGRRLKLDPHFPDECRSTQSTLERSTNAIVSRWQIECALDEGQIGIAGLDRTLTDVFIKIERLDGSKFSAVLKPSNPSVALGSQSEAAPLLAYFRIGVDHIIFGYDHLLFVLGLCLLVRPRQLFWTVTAFTFAHSITLALSTMTCISLPGPPVEAVIALSLILLAREAVMLQRGRTSLTNENPWLVAFGFGLIHGFGFAGALADIGLPQDQEFWALFLFNLGVEFGQAVFVICLWCLAFGLWRLVPRFLPYSKLMAAYTVGAFGMIWMIERVSAF